MSANQISLGNDTCLLSEYPYLDWSCFQFGSCLLDTSMREYHTGYGEDNFSNLILFSIPLNKSQECFNQSVETVNDGIIETYSGDLLYNRTYENCRRRRPDVILGVLLFCFDRNLVIFRWKT